MQPLLHEHAVGAQVDVLAAAENAAHQLAELRIDHRLAAADADDRGAAFVDRVEALLDGQLFLDGLRVFANAAAAGAGQIAGMQRFEHEHERKALRARQLFPGDVAGHGGRQGEGETHDLCPLLSGRPWAAGAQYPVLDTRRSV